MGQWSLVASIGLRQWLNGATACAARLNPRRWRLQGLEILSPGSVLICVGAAKPRLAEVTGETFPTGLPLRWMVRELGVAAVPHGFRSSFRDWAGEETDHPREVIGR